MNKTTRSKVRPCKYWFVRINKDLENLRTTRIEDADDQKV